MAGTAAPCERPIRHSPSLCAGETEYVHKRKQTVLKGLRTLGINCTDAVPHVALLASGGGQRSAVALVGTVYQLEKEGLLDALLYIGGVSGSTWGMASLYSDPHFSTNMDAAVSRLLHPPAIQLKQVLDWVGERAEEENFSLSDIWGALTSAGVMKEMDLRKLSDEARRNATNPYPVYSAIEKSCYLNGPTKGKWFEVSPHEAGFTELGHFIEMSLLGSKFQTGKLLKKRQEMDMVKLQGILGCALADEHKLGDFIPFQLNVAGNVNDPAQEYLKVWDILDKMIALIGQTVTDPVALTCLGNLTKTLEDKINLLKSELVEPASKEQRQVLLNQWTQEMLAAVDTWSASLGDGEFKAHAPSLVKKMIPLIAKWQWGTTANFLYQYKDTLQLIDAGLLINAPYPAFLGDKRDIDLIIAPECSAGTMFETLTLTRDYAAELKKPFPQINSTVLQDSDWPKDCYVFEGKEEEPTVVYMPLFNRHNCKDAAEFKAKMAEFSTFQRSYSPEKIQFVLETAKANVKNNKATLLREINKAASRRQHGRRGRGCGARQGEIKKK